MIQFSNIQTRTWCILSENIKIKRTYLFENKTEFEKLHKRYRNFKKREVLNHMNWSKEDIPFELLSSLLTNKFIKIDRFHFPNH